MLLADSGIEHLPDLWTPFATNACDLGKVAAHDRKAGHQVLVQLVGVAKYVIHAVVRFDRDEAAGDAAAVCTSWSNGRTPRR